MRTEPSPIAWQAARAEVLRRWSLSPAERLGDGAEAEVYALGPERVLRLAKAPIDAAAAARRRCLYEALDRTHVAFAVPAILEQGEIDGVGYSVERRIAGSSLADALAWLTGAARRRALEAYAETAGAIRQLRVAHTRFGEILADQALRAETWDAFVLARAAASLAANHHRLSGLVDQPDRALTRLAGMLAKRPAVERDLVHGDYYPANVMVAADGAITGVVDFGALTIMGDARMDQAGAILYLTGMTAVTGPDRQIVRDRLREQGLGDDDLALYRLFYAVLFLHTSRAGLFGWCIETLRSAC